MTVRLDRAHVQCRMPSPHARQTCETPDVRHLALGTRRQGVVLPACRYAGPWAQGAGATEASTAGVAGVVGLCPPHGSVALVPPL
jgi:hypothetical protein